MASYQQINDGPSSTSTQLPTASSSYPSAGISYNSSAFINPTLQAAANDSERVNKYETRLPLRLDVEAAMAYALLAFSGEVLGWVCEVGRLKDVGADLVS
ncbi:hypothetical protein HDU76_011951, partial [Blyttiomyces sp. JEL0837]